MRCTDARRGVVLPPIVTDPPVEVIPFANVIVVDASSRSVMEDASSVAVGARLAAPASVACSTVRM